MDTAVIERMTSFGHAPALIDELGRCTYAELGEQLVGWRHALDEHEVRAGDVVAVEGSTSTDAVAAILALIERHSVVVPLTRLPAAKRAEFHEVAQVERVIRLGTPGVARTGVRAGHELYQRLRAAGSPGLVLFSSGTTGRSKASVLDFRKVLGRYGPPTRPACTMGFLNLDHIGGINTLLHTISQGGCLVALSERTPERVCAAVAEHRVQVLPTTPTFLNMLLISGAWEHHDLSSLRLITYGTEPMPLGTLRRLAAALPEVRLKQTYGLSELGILPTRSKAHDELWVKLGGQGFEYEVRDGVLWIRSEMAMLGYLNAPAPFDDAGFFNTKDAVEVDGDYVRILGRTSEIINVAGEKVYPSEVENVLLEHPSIADATVTGRPSHVTGMVVKATIKTSGPVEERAFPKEVRDHCRARLEPFKVPAIIEISDAHHHNDRFKKSRTFT